jgi:hypothetical protein
MIKKYNIFLKGTFILSVILLLLAGCGKQEEKPVTQKSDTSKVKLVDTTTAKKMAEVKKDTIPDLTGNWSGTFDQRSATMSIIKQTGKEFSAILTINYRQPLNKTVNGTIDPQNNTIKMEDLSASRYSGQYNAQLLNDGKLIRGTFILKADNKPYSFTFKMK